MEKSPDSTSCKKISITEEQSNTDNLAHIDTIPPEILAIAFSYLPEEHSQILQVSKKWYETAKGNLLLKDLFFHHFPSITPPEEVEESSIYDWVIGEIKRKTKVFPDNSGELKEKKGLELLNALNKKEILEEIGQIRQRLTFQQNEERLKEFELEIKDLDPSPALKAWREFEHLHNLEPIYSKIKGNFLWKQDADYQSQNNEQKLNFIKNKIYEHNCLEPIISLSIYNLDITSLPSEVFDLTELQTLKLSQLFHFSGLLPAEIGQLSKLRELSVNCSGLKSLTPEIGHLVNLTDLNLPWNELNSLPTEIGCLVNLTTLDITGSKLDSVPLEILNLTNLRYLGLRGNPLENLDPIRNRY